MGLRGLSKNQDIIQKKINTLRSSTMQFEKGYDLLVHTFLGVKKTVITQENEIRFLVILMCRLCYRICRNDK